MEASPPPPGGTKVVALLLLVLGPGPLAAGEGPALKLTPDVIYRAAEASPGPVIFSHATHVPLADTRCVACHPALFSILRPTQRFTHDEMNAGRRCGACHDGSKASGVQESCDHCHRAGGGS
jgi:c(7)-type cytochrome triheme protein